MAETKDDKSDSQEEKMEIRDKWSHSAEYLLSLLGYAFGPGNILRFPYLTLRNGGGAFLITYFTSLFFSGIPLYLAETYVGQFTQRSCIKCWQSLVPVMKGVGLSMVLLSLVFSMIIQATVAWVVYYMVASLTWTLPWSQCDQPWNTENCVLTIAETLVGNATGGHMGYSNNTTASYSQSAVSVGLNMTGKPMSAAEEYWQYHVLGLSSGIDEIGLPNWKLCLAHLAGEIVVFFCLIKGVRSVGKVVWVTALAPYVLIIIFLVRAALLPGSMDGIRWYLSADYTALTNPETWILGFLQIFYTLGVAYGGPTTMASFNRRNHPFLREAILVPIATAFSSFINGFVIFSCAGFLARKSGIPVDKAMSVGPGLAFVSYPEVTSHLPAGPVWSFLFFLMLFMVVLDSLFVSIEVCVSSIVDEFNLNKNQQMLTLAAIMVINGLFGVMFFTNGGMYLYQLLDWYYSAVFLFMAAVLELISLMWIYGYKRVFDDIESMIGRRPAECILVPMWAVILPVLLTLTMFWSLFKLTKPTYGDYVYPDWSEKLGWSVAVLIMVPAFFYVLAKLVVFATKKDEKIGDILFRSNATTPDEDEKYTAYKNCVVSTVESSNV